MKLTPDIDPMKCLWHERIKVKRSKVKVTGVIWKFFAVSAPWLRPYTPEFQITAHACLLGIYFDFFAGLLTLNLGLHT